MPKGPKGQKRPADVIGICQLDCVLWGILDPALLASECQGVIKFDTLYA
jgi:hypothetical protein